MDESVYQAPQLRQSEKFYRRSVWWMSHRDFFKRLGILAWAVVDGLLMAVFVFAMMDAWLLSKVDDDVALLGLAREPGYVESTQMQAAKPLRVEGSVEVFPSGAGRYDLLARLQNPNTDWYADVSYRFTYSGGETPDVYTAQIYPGDVKPLVALGLDLVSPPVGVKLKVESLAWHRIDSHEIGNFKEWRQDRETFVVTDATITPAATIDKSVVTRSQFTVKNQTAFGYWSVPLTVFLLRGTQVAAVGQTSVETFEPGATKTVSLHWLSAFPGVTTLEVYPNMALFDEDVYMPLSSDARLDTRLEAGQ